MSFAVRQFMILYAACIWSTHTHKKNCGGGNEPTQKVLQGMPCEAVALDPLGAPSVSGCAATPALAVAARLR